MTFGSLFSGVGGLDLGLERAGMRLAWQVEANEFRRSVLARHWPAVRRHDDVKTFPPGPADDWRCDLVAGGDPCQENSKARQNRTGRGLEQPSLGGEFIRVVDALRPRIVLRENPSSADGKAPWPWTRFRSELERLGYAVLPFRLRACCLGAEHQRDRLFLLAQLPDPLQAGLEGHEFREMEEAARREGDADPAGRHRGHTAPVLCRKGARVPRRVDRIAALGDAVDVRVAEWIGRRIVEVAE